LALGSRLLFYIVSQLSVLCVAPMRLQGDNVSVFIVDQIVKTFFVIVRSM